MRLALVGFTAVVVSGLIFLTSTKASHADELDKLKTDLQRDRDEVVVQDDKGEKVVEEVVRGEVPEIGVLLSDRCLYLVGSRRQERNCD